MKYRVMLVAGGLVLSTLVATAQQSNSYRAPRTPDGVPDLQGFWTNLTYTPFERPRELANKPFYTEQEANDFFNRAVAGAENQIVHYVNADYGATPVQTGARPNRRTSLVTDPADGRIPPLTPEALKKQQAIIAANKARGPLVQTWRDDRGTEWCVFHDRAVPAIVAPYGSNYHIVQSKDWIVITYEWNTERRQIALDGRPHGAVRTYAGDSRGHWEGDTLVVETTNFTERRTFLGQPGTPPAVEASPALTLVERFTRTADDALLHTYTVTDEATWTRPWTVELPMYRIKGPMLEYACNENNQDGFAALKNARLQEAGKLAPMDPIRTGDAKAEISGHAESGAATVIGVDSKDESK